MDTSHTAKYLDSGFYIVSDKAAKALVSVIGHELPGFGYQKFVMLELTTESGETYRVNAWLQRTDVRHSMLIENRPARGWVWAIFGMRRDSAQYLPVLGREFPFTAVNSTLATATR